MEEKVLMPKALTAENGAKAAMMGEFSQWETLPCMCSDPGECDVCEGTGEMQQEVCISWTTIKEIYAKAVTFFASNNAIHKDGGSGTVLEGVDYTVNHVDAETISLTRRL